MSTLLDAAQWYVRVLDWPVFPLVPGGKRPLVDEAAGFAHGFHDATLSASRIQDVWTRFPDANIGTPTGPEGCRLDVIDVDGTVGLASWHDELQPFLGSLTRACSRTPRGMHVFLQARGSTNGTALRPGIDTRGSGGYVVLPPSVGPQGSRYTWLDYPPVAA